MERRRKQNSNQPTKNSSPQLRDHTQLRVRVFNTQRDMPILRKSVESLVRFVLHKKKVVSGEISIYLVSKKKITLLHKDFFQDPTPTDCISFPIDSIYLGDIFVCPKVAQEYDPKAPYRETILYIIHGILHLLGYDDIEKKEREKMHREQRRLLLLAKNFWENQAKISPLE